MIDRDDLVTVRHSYLCLLEKKEPNRKALTALFPNRLVDARSVLVLSSSVLLHTNYMYTSAMLCFVAWACLASYMLCLHFTQSLSRPSTGPPPPFPLRSAPAPPLPFPRRRCHPPPPPRSHHPHRPLPTPQRHHHRRQRQAAGPAGPGLRAPARGGWGSGRSHRNPPGARPLPRCPRA